MIEKDDNNKDRVKIIDWGTSTFFKTGNNYLS
jgi:hypothetical protein